MNIDQTVTERIVKQLDAGTAPWRRAWTTGLPKSLTHRREFRGANILLLAMAGYTSRYWVTAREALRLGGHVRNGEQPTPVVSWHWCTPEALREVAPRTGTQNLLCVPFTCAVFNLDQVESVARPEEAVPRPRPQRLVLADLVFDVMPDKPAIVHARTPEATYSARLDRVTLPHLSQFVNADAYYATLFRELIRAAGHPRRLNRFAAVEGDPVEPYACEALVAELGAAFLCAFAGISNPVSEAQQASYIKGWTQAIRNDPRLILRAATAAQRAADYIRGKGAAVRANAAANEVHRMEVSHA